MKPVKIDSTDPYGILSGCGAATQIDLSSLDLGVDHSRPKPLDANPIIERGAGPGDKCISCLQPLIVRDMNYECPSCNAVYQAADLREVISVSAPAEPGAKALRGRLRIVGPDSKWYQPDMDRTNPGPYSEIQKMTTFRELTRLNENYKNRGGDPFPLDVLKDVVTNYNFVQQEAVKRSHMKLTILAALLFHACIFRGFARSKREVAEFAGLKNHGIARGDDYLRKIDEDKGLEIDMNQCRLLPHIRTALMKLGLNGPEYKPIQVAIEEIVRRAIKSSVGIKSILRSKVFATTYEVIARGAHILKKIDPRYTPITLNDISEKCKIRKHTIVRFRNDLEDYHSFFEDIYKAHGLLSAPISDLEAPQSKTSSHA